MALTAMSAITRFLVRPPVRIGIGAVCLWGALVGLHGLGFPGVRLLRIPGATGLPPASVQNALAAMVAPARLASNPALQGEEPSREYGRVAPFADAGPRDQIDDVEMGLADDLHREDATEFTPDGRLARGWQAAVRATFTPTGAALEIDGISRGSDGPGPCKHTRHLLVGWQGVYVDGSRALALTEERTDCVAPGPTFRAPVEHFQYALRRINGRWRIEEWASRDNEQY
jgi:hypothetical protein